MVMGLDYKSLKNGNYHWEDTGVEGSSIIILDNMVK